jgi:amino acid adenylation domain-containing protein
VLTLPLLFQEQASRRPDAPAVIHPDSGVTLTYAELDERSAALAGALAARGVGPGTRVAICLTAGVERVVSFLAATRTGAAYVPLDPTNPARRLRTIVETSGAAGVVTEAQFANNFARTPVVLADRPGRDVAPTTDPGPEDPAIVYFTSGTTGKPKGVVIPHRAVASFLGSFGSLAVTETDRVMHTASPGFDAATFEIWSPLVTGAPVVVLSRETLLDPTALATAIRDHRISTVFLTTAVFHLVVTEQPRAFEAVRLVIFGGDVADPAKIRAALKNPPQHLVHAYGPTEATTFCVWQELTELPDGARSVPIGHAMGETRLYVLDEDQREADVGELCIAGPNLAHGYLDQPELTAGKFVADPFVPGERMYRTGDRVRLLDDGGIDFIGRNDHQVKVRGVRIELGEIDATLTAHPDVAEAITIARGAGTDDRVLAAFVVPAKGVEPEGLTGRLKQHLRRLLPEAMVPPTMTVLERIPLSATGKVDRAALASAAAPARSAAAAGELSELELFVVSAWANLIGVPSVGLHDEFFTIGGHSLLLGRLSARYRAMLGVRMPVRELIANRTPADQVRWLLANEPSPGAFASAVAEPVHQ